jgi:hypothetical protein
MINIGQRTRSALRIGALAAVLATGASFVPAQAAQASPVAQAAAPRWVYWNVYYHGLAECVRVAEILMRDYDFMLAYKCIRDDYGAHALWMYY